MKREEMLAVMRDMIPTDLGPMPPVRIYSPYRLKCLEEPGKWISLEGKKHPSVPAWAYGPDWERHSRKQLDGSYTIWIRFIGE